MAKLRKKNWKSIKTKKKCKTEINKLKIVLNS